MIGRSRRIAPSFVACFALAVTSTRTHGAEAAALDPATTHAVVVGVLHWQSPSLSTYPTDDRKDLELYNTLADIGVAKERMVVLLDEQATLANIRDALANACDKTQKGDTLIFYFAGHGTSVDGKACLMNYDVDTKRTVDTALTSAELAEIFKAKFRGHRVLMFADCCFSGALARTTEELAKHGFEAASITSASDSVTSTNNWTFTHLLIEILRGNPDSDLNDDGAITFTEAAQEVADAMKYRENQAHGSSRFGVPEEFRLSRTRGDRADAEVPAPFSLFEYVQIRQSERWRTARIVNYADGLFAAEVQKYASREIVNVDAEHIRKYLKPEPEQFAADPLPLREALAKARVDGKYTELLEIFEAPTDVRAYSPFNDYGFYEATNYAGQSNLPAGYWVYVYPNWYIWKTEIIQ